MINDDLITLAYQNNQRLAYDWFQEYINNLIYYFSIKDMT